MALSKTQQDALEQIAWKGRALPVRLGSRLAPTWMTRRAQGASQVHLGCGPNILRGWANLDMGGPSGVVRFDCSRPLPFASGSVDVVFSEHFIEHVRRDQAVSVIRECFRILRPGGVLRLSTPDLAALVSEYLAGRTDEWLDMGWAPRRPCDLMNEGMRLWGHQYVWDEDALTAVLVEERFSTVVRVSWHESDHADLRGLESRPFHGDLILEATK
jgi:predicted SAM-dependent methyltransferase